MNMPPQPVDADYHLALENCSREPVHIPGRVQPFGCLLGLNQNFDIVQATDNVQDIVTAGGELIGKNFQQVFSDREILHELRNVVGLPTITTQRERLGQFHLGGTAIDVATHRVGDTIVLEMERDDHPRERPGTAIARVRSLLGLVTSRGPSAELVQSAVTALRRLTGFDRVMGYRFLSSGDGEVVAEACSPGDEPFLGLRYPASDIPQQVRDGMIKMPFRCIVDIDATHSVLRSEHGQPPLDLTLTHLKGVSPIHVEYLRNMDVRATMNIPIICQGELWGLFAFHHRRPRLLSPGLRSVCELFGHFFSLEIQQNLERRLIAHRRRATSLQRSIKQKDHRRLLDVVQAVGRDLLTLMDADGLRVVSDQDSTHLGQSLSQRDTESLLRSSNNELIILETFTDSTIKISSEGDAKVGGALAIKLGGDTTSAIVFYRDEIISQIRWAGHPEKRIEFGPNGPRLHPRASFKEYVQSVGGRCRPWELTQLAAARELRSALMDLLYQETKVNSDQWRQQKEYQDLLIAELNHRVKNVLALVRSIARQSQANATSLAQHVEAFEDRIAALASAHDLIGGSGLQWAPLASMIRTEVQPFANQSDRIDLSGPPVALKSDVAPVLALVFHELVTNAAKYGALSNDTGQLRVRWTHRDGGLQIDWREISARVDQSAITSGFGLSLIRRAVPHECGGEASVNFSSDGMTASFWLPNEHIQQVDQDEITPNDTDKQSLDGQMPNVELALVVEDNMVISMEMESMLLELGCQNVHAAGGLSQAMPMAAKHRYQLAVLDVNLSGTDSFEIARQLIHAGTPVIFVSGYGETFPVPAELRRARRLAKPVRRETLLATMREVLTNCPRSQSAAEAD